MVHIALVLMVKNEQKRIHVTLESVLGYVDSLIIYDTGSTDSTISILQEFSKKHNLPLRLKVGEFVNYAVSRNILLDYADTFSDVDFILLMDCNDELRGGKELRQFCQQHILSTENAWHVQQEWFSGDHTNNYFNVRLLKPRQYWRFKGVVHEWITNLQDEHKINYCSRLPSPILMYQDRTQDDDKSLKRFPMDAKLLLEECSKNPKDARSHFYLAQTYSCMNMLEEAYKYYMIRAKLQGFEDEVFHCWLRMGLISNQLRVAGQEKYTWELSLGHFMKAVEHSMRAEPLVYIATYYMEKQKWEIAYHYARWACSLDYPSDTALFVDKYMYHYTRFHVLGIVAFYAKKFKEGIVACKIAIDRENKDVDKHNLVFYQKEMSQLKL